VKVYTNLLTGGESFLVFTLISLFGRKGPLSRVKNVDLLGARGKRGGSPSVSDSPLSSVADTSLHGDEDFASLGLG
jgi:hypothetical protein